MDKFVKVDLLRKLRENFGHDNFKSDLQKKAIEAIIQSKYSYLFYAEVTSHFFPYIRDGIVGLWTSVVEGPLY